MAEKVEAVLEVKVESDAAVRGANAVTQAMEGLNKAYSRTADLAGKAMKWGAWAKEQADFAGRTLQTKAAFDQLNVSMSRLERASGGQVSQLRLMEAANKSLRGSMGLTQKQFELTLVAADNLSDQGFGDQIEIQERLAQALKTGSGRALREFGIRVDETKGKLAAHNAILKEYKGIAGNTTAEDALSKGLDQFSARVENASVRLRTVIGGATAMTILWLDQLIAKLGLLEGEGEDREARLSRMARGQTEAALGFTSETMGKRKTNEQLGAFVGLGRAQWMQELVPGLGATVSYADSANRTQDIMTRGKADYERRLAALRKAAQQEDSLWKTYEAKLEADAERRQKAALAEQDALRWAAAAAERRKKLRGLLGYSPREGGDVIGGFIGGAVSSRVRGGPGEDYSYTDDRTLAQQVEARSRLEALMGSVATGAATGRAKSTGAGFFGGGGQGMADRIAALDNFNKKLLDTNTLLGASFTTVSNGLVGAIDAAITGQESATKAFRRGIGGQLSALSKQYAVMALGQAAGFNWVSAAKYGAAAVAAGVAAHELGSSGGTTSVPSGIRPSGGFGGGPSTVIVNVSGSTSGSTISNAISGAR